MLQIMTTTWATVSTLHAKSRLRFYVYNSAKWTTNDCISLSNKCGVGAVVADSNSQHASPNVTIILCIDVSRVNSDTITRHANNKNIHGSKVRGDAQPSLQLQDYSYPLWPSAHIAFRSQTDLISLLVLFFLFKWNDRRSTICTLICNVVS